MIILRISNAMVRQKIGYLNSCFPKWTLWQILLCCCSYIFGFGASDAPSESTPAAQLSKIACEGEILNITCPPDRYINIIRANYGRFSLLECNERNEAWENLECMYPKSTVVMQERCQYRRSCYVAADDHTFADECPATAKYLQAIYQCLRNTERSTYPFTTASMSRLAPETAIAAIPEGIPSKRPPKLDPRKVRPDGSRSYCPEVTRRGMKWPSTRVNNSARISCPNSLEEHVYAEWNCSSEGSWLTGQPDLSRCVSRRVNEIRIEAASANNRTHVTSIAAQLRSETSPAHQLYGGDVTGCTEALLALSTSDPVQAQEQPQHFYGDLLKSFAEVGSNLLNDGNNEAWLEIPAVNRSMAGDALLSAIDSAATRTAAEGYPGVYYASYRIGVEISEPIAPDQSYFHFPTAALLPNVTVNVKLPGSILKRGSTDSLNSTRVVFIYYDKTLGDYLSSHGPAAVHSAGRSTWSNLVTLTVLQFDPATQRHRVSHFAQLAQPVLITFSVHRLDHNLSAVCVFWESARKEWSDDGCWKQGENTTHVTCACNHLTTFAVLMDVYGVVHDVQHHLVLLFVTYFGCITSILCCAMAIVAFCLFQSPSHQDRVTIHRNLCLCLMLAELLFILGVDRTDWPAMCAVVAASLHYLFLAAFAWMLLEGVQLYILLIEVFEAESRRRVYFYLFGYGAPLVIVGASLLIDHRSYGTDRHCWLSTEKYFVYSFIGPVAVVLLANLLFLVMTLVVLCRHMNYASSYRSDRERSSMMDSICVRLKGAVTLFVLLGLTWTLGLLYVLHPSVTAAYAFTVLNSLQGAFVFVFHVFLNKQVRKDVESRLHRLMGRRKPHWWRTSTSLRTKGTNEEPLPMLGNNGPSLSLEGNEARDAIRIRLKQHGQSKRSSASPLVSSTSSSSSSRSKSENPYLSRDTTYSDTVVDWSTIHHTPGM